ncbi:MAG: Zn-ribbon domain-containing OB-fold protein [Burkholderiales bacterium]|nr:Zn-ribbon domain-containing OB-fold protein [Burkholderiales bacterium]
MALPFPEPQTAEARHFFAAAAEGRLELQRCAACGRVWFFPRPACVACGATDYAWLRASGRGTLHSFSIVRRAPSAEFRERVPYVVALVDLEEGPRMMANVLGEGALEVSIGDALELTFEERGEGRRLPQFRRAKS